MADLRAAAQQALEALWFANSLHRVGNKTIEKAIDSLQAALEQPEQAEPVAWACFKNGELQTELIGTEADVDFWCKSDEVQMQGMVKKPLYTHPPRREWRGLTDEQEIANCWHGTPWNADLKTRVFAFFHTVEAALRSKNHE